MQILRSLESLGEIALAIGNFDGVHKGHQYILQRLLAQKNQGLKPILLSFFPHPKSKIEGKEPPLLSCLRERAYWLNFYGLEFWCLQHFSDSFRRQSASEFIENFLNKNQVKKIFVGEDFRFAYRGEGNIDTLLRESAFSTEIIPAIKINNLRVSSTDIRRNLHNHDLVTASALLGHPLTLSGKVRHGAQRGRTIGIPTANIHIPINMAVPNGVYVVKSDNFWGVANLGYAPSFAEQERKLEVHFFHDVGNIYGKCLRIELHDYLRAEKKFPDLSALQAQINQDIYEAKALIKQKNNEVL